MTVDQFAHALSGRLEFVRDSYYHNKSGQVGYRAIYRGGGCYYWFSVSATDARFAPDEVAAAIADPERNISREYPYVNGVGQLGFEATVRSGDHSFMLNASPDLPSSW
jgi:hypothetical protein